MKPNYYLWIGLGFIIVAGMILYFSESGIIGMVTYSGEINYQEMCENYDGIWENNECKFITKEQCELMGGEFNSCGSSCPPTEGGKGGGTICIQVCVPVCKF